MNRISSYLPKALFLVCIGCTSSGSGGPDAGQAPTLEGFVSIEPGAFVMGSPLDEPGRNAELEAPHDVVLTRPFFLKETELTQAEVETLLGVNPSYFTDCSESCPAEYLNWWEALAATNALSEAESLAPCYELVGCSGDIGLDFACEAVTVLAEGQDPLSCEGYRLPTEAEWEYGARAGSTTAFAAGGFAPGEPEAGACADVAALADASWYCGNSLDTPHPVRTKQANAWGLHDMGGNNREWVWDLLAPYASAPITDPLGPDEGAIRALRGGSWSGAAADCRSAARDGLDPAERDGDTGLRPARTRSR